MKTACLLFGLSASVCLSAETLTIWPSDLCTPVANPGATFAMKDGNTIAVDAQPTHAWPGVAMDVSGERLDLTRYGKVLVRVQNSDVRPLTICLSVKSKGLKDGPGGRVTLRAGETGELVATLRPSPWTLDAPRELVGMNNYPKAATNDTLLARVSSLHVFLNQKEMSGEPARFHVLGITARPAPVKPLKAASFFPFVDAFGQFIHDDWPGKIHSAEELETSRKEEAQWLAQAEPMPERNRWGGWTKGPSLKATGHFRTEKLNGTWWLVDPDGSLFFSHGVDCVRAGASTGIEHREAYFAWLPPKEDPLAAYYGQESWAPHNFYKGKTPFKTFDFSSANMSRKYGSEWKKIFQDLAHARIRAWGLNTVANWSDSTVYLLRKTPYTASFTTWAPVIEGSEGWWGKFADPFAPAFRESVLQGIKRQKEQGTTEDPWCIGYFVDNELSWGKDDQSLAEATLASPPSQPSKIAFRAWLIKKYESLERLNAAWKTSYLSWDDFLERRALPAGKDPVPDITAFHSEIAEHYFRTIRDILKEHAPNKLYLGCRIAWGAPSVFRAAAKHCDVVSLNIYSRHINKDLPPDAMDKPMINGEFHFGALDRGLFHTGLVPTESQSERAACYRNFVMECLHHPRFVGTHWFQWRDQALTGRGDGENYQIGFLTVTDRPYPELVEAARDIGKRMYDARYSRTLSSAP